MTETELEKAEAALAQAKARVQKIKAKARSDERKQDTRRKVILGGAVLATARHDPIVATQVRMWIEQMSERDRSAFEGWNL